MSVREYVEILVAIEKESARAKLLDGFMTLIHKRGHERLLPRIMRAYEEDKKRRDARSRVKLSIAKKGDDHAFAKEIKHASESFGEGEREIVVDENIVGGFILESATKRVDRSFRSTLLSLYRNITA